MAGPLDNIRVIDLTSGPVGGIATMVLADFGADVIKVERPGGDPFRFMPSAPMWLRGKRSIVLDLKQAADQQRLADLVETADVVVTSFRGQTAGGLGCDYDTLVARNPCLIYCQISSFGVEGPYASYPGYEGVVAAKAGRMMSFSGVAPRPGPQFVAVQVASHATSQAVVTGILAGLVARERDGRGRYVETSMLQGMLPYDMGGLLQTSFRSRKPEQWPVPPTPTMPTINYHPALTKDGKWIQLGNLLQHLFDNFVAATEMFDIYADGEHEGSPAMWSEAVREAFRDRMLLLMREKTSDEWMEIFIAHGGVVAHPYYSTQEALDDPDVWMNGHVIEVPDSRGPGYPPMRQIGLVARLTETPGTPGGFMAVVGAHAASIAGEVRRTTPSAAAGQQPARAPLDGVTVLDFSTIIAAPMACSHLADLGARVIKIEQVGGDPYRWMGNGSLGALKTNAGKESICVDLKDPQGQAIVLALVAKADIIVHNFRPGVSERLGIAYEQAKQVEPDIIYVNANGYGPDGPSAHRPATHPIPGAALGGAHYQAGGMPPASDDLKVMREGARRLFRANEVNPDPNTSAMIATTAMLGLWARERTGTGQEIFIDMMGANAYANADDFFWYEGREPRPVIDEGLHGTGPLYRLYECRSGWVFLGIMQEKEWVKFCERVGRPELAADVHFSTRAKRAANSGTLTKILEGLFRTDTADSWEQLLAGAGLGCVRADGPVPGEFFLHDEHVSANQFIAAVEHLTYGPYERHGAVVRMRGAPSRLGPGPMAGQHTDSLLTELGYSAEQIAGLRASNIVWSEPGAATSLATRQA
ncbi:MAG: CoA transferase [Dehalococcoidia bacterium]|nr:CoA transferase [Dehalococcoidia bacterium]